MAASVACWICRAICLPSQRPRPCKGCGTSFCRKCIRLYVPFSACDNPDCAVEICSYCSVAFNDRNSFCLPECATEFYLGVEEDKAADEEGIYIGSSMSSDDEEEEEEGEFDDFIAPDSPENHPPPDEESSVEQMESESEDASSEEHEEEMDSEEEEEQANQCGGALSVEKAEVAD